jgi:GH25 family lysozyme M1 (1,4-beta-N-acetylmuramidase)
MGEIIDISKWQNPDKINYDKLCSQLTMAIVRVQYGSNLIDIHYKTHIREMRSHGVPFGVYAFARGVSKKDMEKEATDFYNRSKNQAPFFYVIDVEEKTMRNMRSGIDAYIKKLRSLTDKKIGIYISHHKYKEFNLNLRKADFVWIPHYGYNNGKVSSRPKFSCDLHQYTSKGKLNGYNGYLDLNRFMGRRTVCFFIKNNAVLKLQKALNKDGVKDNQNKKLKEDGTFGKCTESAVKRLELNTTFNKEGKYIYYVPKSKGYVVRFVQKKVGTKVDGYYGKNTKAAVKKYQKAKNIAIDGIAGIQTIRMML